LVFGKGYTKGDASRDTASETSEVSGAWHQARDDSGVRKGSGGDRPTERNRDEAATKTAEIIERARK
jgi:hypothetical protein